LAPNIQAAALKMNTRKLGLAGGPADIAGPISRRQPLAVSNGAQNFGDTSTISA